MQARTVDLILVTELTRWGRSARFAARSLTCFKFRFVSSPQESGPKPPPSDQTAYALNLTSRFAKSTVPSAQT